MKIGVLGSGAYGIALSHILINNKNKVINWTPNETECKELNIKKVSAKIKNYKIKSEQIFTTDLEVAVKDKDLIVIAVPAFAFTETILKIKKYIKKEQVILIATKGIEQNTCLFLSDILRNHLKNPYAVISGPTFASDIVNNSQVGFSLATKSRKADLIVRACFENDITKFRTTRDIIGIEICGSIKNVMAIASGILEGMNVTDSTRALFLTESMNDIKELIDALGGKKKSILSFAGFGDILMTCTSKNSRNFTFGYLIGCNKHQKEIEEYKNTNTIEGLYTLKSINKLVRKKKVKMPIIHLINDIISGSKEKEELLKFLIAK